MSKSFSGKVAVVTGASTGIGASVALGFARAGAQAVVVNYLRSEQEAEAVVTGIKALGCQAIKIQADLSKQADIECLISGTLDAFDSIDVLVNNAGADILTGRGASWSLSEKLDRLIHVDLLGTINTCWAVAPLMKSQGGGVIVNMAWDLAVHGFAGINPQLFAASKAGIVGFSRSFAKSVAPFIRVNMVAPGWIETAFAADYMPKDYYQERLEEIPLARFGNAHEVADAIIFLASDSASYIHGEMLKINGGMI